MQTSSLDGTNVVDTGTDEMATSSSSGYNSHTTADKTIEFVVNGKDSTKMKLDIKGYECVDNSCTDTSKSEAIESDGRLWSESSSWTSNEVPKCGSDVIVENPWNMIYDMEVDHCIYKSVKIEGRLTFKRADSAVA